MNVSNFLKIIKKQKKSQKIRLYIIDKNEHYFLNDGVLKNGFNPKLTVTKNRECFICILKNGISI